MRKLLVWVIGVVMAVSLTACSGGSQNASSETTEAAKTTTVAGADTDQKVQTWSVEVTCANVLDHKDDLESNYEIPSKGEIYSGDVEVEEDETAMTILEKTGVTIDKKDGYVQGIDGLYAGDCGDYSGWMYQVNGKTPDVGADEYKVNEGDEVQWYYVCDEEDF
mgnify:CR=1 FL=1